MTRRNPLSSFFLSTVVWGRLKEVIFLLLTPFPSVLLFLDSCKRFVSIREAPYNSTVLTFESTVHSSRKLLENIKLFPAQKNHCHYVCLGFDAHIFSRRSTTYERTGRSQILQGQKNVSDSPGLVPVRKKNFSSFP